MGNALTWMFLVGFAVVAAAVALLYVRMERLARV